MKKLWIIAIVSILIISSMGAIALSEHSDDIQNQDTAFTVSLSKLSIEENGQYVSVEMHKSNGYLMKPETAKLPSHVETYIFPKGTEIIDIQCEPISVESLQLQKKIEQSPQPVLSNGKNI